MEDRRLLCWGGGREGGSLCPLKLVGSGVTLFTLFTGDVYCYSPVVSALCMTRSTGQQYPVDHTSSLFAKGWTLQDVSHVTSTSTSDDTLNFLAGSKLFAVKKSVLKKSYQGSVLLLVL